MIECGVCVCVYTEYNPSKGERGGCVRRRTERTTVDDGNDDEDVVILRLWFLDF